MKRSVRLPVLPLNGLSKQAFICSHECKGRCCSYVIVKIPAPRTRADHQEIRWWLAHHGVSVHIAQRKWHLQMTTRCGYLTPDNLCGAYENRPDVCRDYDPSDCEFTGEPDIEREFATMEVYDRYLEEKRRQRRAAGQKKRHSNHRRRQPTLRQSA